MRKILLILCIGFLSSTIYAQDQCTPMGWGTENGGVTGGGNATPVVVTSHSELVNALDNEEKVIHISGTITFPSNGRITIQDLSGLTIFGLPGARLVSTDLSSGGSGIFYIKRVTNLILQNITFEGPGAYDEDGYDNLCIDDCQNVWVDHCDFQDGMDGNFDIKNMSDYVSVSWCVFQYKKAPIAGGSGGSDDHRYTNLIGSSASAIEDRNHLNTTFQYCWWGEGCRERMPRVRFGKIHLLNNYFSSAVTNYCARAGEEANILLEGNYFDDQNEPVDLYKSNAIVAESNNVSTGASITTQNPGSVFSPPYAYAVADPNTIITPITTCAGATLPSFGACSPCAGGAINIPPSVSLTSPTDGTVFSPGETIALTASASDSDGSVADVKFYDGASLIGTSYSGYSVSWSGATEGAHTITAVATDDEGAQTTSSLITLTFSAAYTVSVSTSGAPGLVTPDVNGTYYSDDEVTVSAIEYIGSLFAGWTGDVTSSEKELTFTVSGNTNITANFTTTANATTYEMEEGYYENGIAALENENAGYSGTGYVNTENAVDTWTEITVYAPTNDTYSCELFYAAISDRPVSISVNGSEQIASQAMPNTVDWTVWTSTTFSLDLTSGANTIRVTAIGDEGAPNLDKIAISVNMGTTYSLTVNQANGGTISPTSGTYAEGTSVTISASADNGYSFDSWLGDVTGTTNPVMMTMDGDKTVTAVFTQDPIVFQVNLTEGWNLIGYPLDESVELSVAFADIWDKVICVKNADGFYFQNQDPTLNSLNQLDWSGGYFIKVSEDCGFNWID